MVFGKSGGSKLSGFISSLKDASVVFQLHLKDRDSAGKALAMVLKAVVKRKKEDNDLLVLGIPRGGVIVADIIANKIHADYFDIVIPRKLRAPHNKENSIGAISQDASIVYLDEFMMQSLKVPPEYIKQEIQEQLKEIERRTALYRSAASHRVGYPITPGKTIVVLIDDGIASGATVIAAARWIRSKYKPAQLIIAAPVASKQAIELLKKESVADIVETVTTPSRFVSVNQFYRDFEQVTDDRVIEILKENNRFITK